LFEKSGIEKKPGLHIFRHTFATQFLYNGGDIYTLKEFLGHSDLKTTAIYIHLTHKFFKREIKRLPNYLQQVSNKYELEIDYTKVTQIVDIETKNESKQLVN